MIGMLSGMVTESRSNYLVSTIQIGGNNGSSIDIDTRLVGHIFVRDVPLDDAATAIFNNDGSRLGQQRA